MVLMFVQSLLYSTEKIYMVYKDKLGTYYHELEGPIFNCQIVAMHSFMMQHALFVGQYARVAVEVPLTFV